MDCRHPLVLLHPLGSDRSFWTSVTPLLDGSTLLAPDLLGHGEADLPPLGATIRDYTHAVLAECDARGIGPATIVGVSLGGLVAQDLAARFPERVAGLVLADTVATYPPELRANWHERARLARSEGLAPLADPTAEMWFTPEFRARDPRVARDVRRRFLEGSVEGYARTCEALASADSTHALAGIDSPTLVVCGTADAPAFVDSAHELTTRIRGARLLWLEGRHAAVLEQPERFADAVRELVARAADARSDPS